MITDSRSAHKHITGGKESTANGGHTHGLTAVETALDDKAPLDHTHPTVSHTHPEIAALEARIAALESPPVDPPPVDPPPVDPPPVVPPVIPGAVYVPSSIDKTGATGVSAALNAWIAAQPNGSKLVFPQGAIYKLDGDAGLYFGGRTGLEVTGTDCKLINACIGSSNFSASFFLQNSLDILIRGFSVDGLNTFTGTVNAKSGVNEKINAAVIRAGCKRIVFDSVAWDKIKGFGPLVSADGGVTWPEDVTIQDCIIRGGEMGIGIVAGRRVKLLGNTIADSVYMAIDAEPDASQSGGGGFVDLLIDANEVDGYGWGQTLTSWFLAACPQDAVIATCIMDGLIVTGNNVVRGAVGPANGNAVGVGGLGIRSDKTNRKRNVVISGNTTVTPDVRSASRAVMNLVNVENLTVTGNRQPITNGASLVSDSGTTGTRNIGSNNTTP